MPGVEDACPREAGWLATHGDGLPALLRANGGKWDVVQAYWPGARAATQKRGVYVLLRDNTDQLPNAQRVRPQHTFTLKLTWPVKNVTGSARAGLAETEQANFAAALTDLITRIRGPFLNKTHGGRFLSVAQVPDGRSWTRTTWLDPEQTIAADRALRAEVTYMADDIEISG